MEAYLAARRGPGCCEVVGAAFGAVRGDRRWGRPGFGAVVVPGGRAVAVGHTGLPSWGRGRAAVVVGCNGGRGGDCCCWAGPARRGDGARFVVRRTCGGLEGMLVELATAAARRCASCQSWLRRACASSVVVTPPSRGCPARSGQWAGPSAAERALAAQSQRVASRSSPPLVAWEEQSGHHGMSKTPWRAVIRSRASVCCRVARGWPRAAVVALDGTEFSLCWRREEFADVFSFSVPREQPPEQPFVANDPDYANLRQV